MKPVVLIIGLFCLSISTYAQIPEGGDLLFGLKGGYVTSTLQGMMESVLAGEDRQIERSYAKDYWRSGFSIDGFFHYRFEAPLTMNIEGSYSRLGGDIKMKIDSLGPYIPYGVYNEHIYDYFHVNGVINFHPFLLGYRTKETALSGIRFSIGVQGGVPIPGKRSIIYNTNDPTVTPEEARGVEKRLETYFQPEPYWGAIGGIGYEYYWEDKIGLFFDGRLIYGISDAVLTRPHSKWNYADETVHSIAVVGSFGVMFKIAQYDY